MRIKRLSGLLTVILVSALAVSETARAEIAPRNPTSVSSVALVLNASDEVLLTCDRMSGGGVTTSFLADSLTSPDGVLEGYGFWAWALQSEPYVGVQVGPFATTHTLYEQSGDFTGFAQARAVAQADGSIYRAAWASWGETMTCSVILDNSFMEESDLPAERAIYALPLDFSGGVGAGAYATVSTMGVFSRNSDGYLFALIAPQFGWTKVVGPSGEKYEKSGQSPFVAITGGGAGTWDFYLRAAAQYHGGSILWWIDVPSPLIAPSANNH